MRSVRWALRLRTVADKHLIAMKGPAVKTEYGALSRPEIEAEWSRDALGDIIRRAKDIGAAPAVSDTIFHDRDPVQTLHELGFVTIQDRETERHVRHVMDYNLKPVVEMALDYVKYAAGGRTVGHYEIELESMTSGAESAIRQVSDELMRVYGDALRPWRHDKLVLGWAIERLLTESGTLGLISDDHLTSSAYDRLDELPSHK